MTNWDKIKEGTKDLFIDEIKPEDFADIISSLGYCDVCRIQDYCDKCMYKTNENGDFILDDNGDKVFDDETDTPSCEEIILKWLKQECK